MVYASIDLDELREQHLNSSVKPPFQHQIEAFTALSQTFKLGSEKPGSGILVLPTGAGKTLTAVKWLSTHVIPKNVKILWLAPSFYLLDQAFATFCETAREIGYPKQQLNIRCVSSNPSHAKASSIQITDDVVIMTTQTAIKNLHVDAVDRFGNSVQTALKKFILNCKNTDFFVILDEAHHAPAYGCRNLLIGEQDSALGLRKLLPQHHLLGLTATPTYTVKSRRGWLWKIFSDGIIYETDKASLFAQKILARPNYIEVSTGIEMQVDDGLYNRLVRQHKDLPEEIIEKLANDQKRNNFIVDNYTLNKDVYGKTIIFADRWYQCIYLKQKLLEKGINADAIYSHVDADPSSVEARNKRTQNENKRILEQFKAGKDERGKESPIDVLINVRMLTEGADVPSVQTVFLTRQTTSSILMNQMIGRALRGERVGGSSEANIVLFFDEWKRLIDWANLRDGGTEPDKSTVKGYYPLEYISIRLVEELCKTIASGGDYQIPAFSKIFPTGWYKTEIVYADADNQQDSMEGFTEFILVYEHTKAKFTSFINFMLSSSYLDEWSKEYLDDKWMNLRAEEWIDKWFDYKNDDIGQKLSSDLIKIVRHIAQNQAEPTYHPFEERELYNLDKLAQKIIDFKPREQFEYLSREFSKPGILWKTFYKSFHRFKTAVDGVINTILHSEIYGKTTPDFPLPKPITTFVRELTELDKEQVKKRDGYTCLCCGAGGKGVRLEIDHIVSIFLGGETVLENSQTLCSVCNKEKGINEINFRFNATQLNRPKMLDLAFPIQGQDVVRVITRIVNFFYHCKAVCQVNIHERRNGKYYSIWEIHLYAGNNPEWLLHHKAEILKFIQNRLGWTHVQDIKITAPN